MHTDIPKKVDKIFVGQPSSLGGGPSRPPRPLGPLRPSTYFGLPMVNQSKSSLPPNKP